MFLVFLGNQNMLYMQQFHWRTRFLHKWNFWELLPNHYSESSTSRLISLSQSTHNAILGSKRDSFMNIAWLARYQRKIERLKEAWQQNLGLDLFNGKTRGDDKKFFKGEKASWNKLLFIGVKLICRKSFDKIYYYLHCFLSCHSTI